MGNEMDASHIPPGYNRKILALDVEGKAQMIVIENPDASHIPPGYNRKILAPDVEGKAQMIARC